MGRKKVEVEVVDAPAVEEVNPLTVEVETVNGVKVVNGSDAAEVAQAVEAVKADPKLVEPNIDGTEHANLTYAEIQAL